MIHPITVEQYEGFDGYEGVRDELINGRIVMSPAPTAAHRQIAENIDNLLDTVLQDKPYVSHQNTNVRFADLHSMPAPDVLVIDRQIWLEACEKDTYLTHPPALVVEVLSPANCKRHVTEKVELYLSQGVRAVWIVTAKDRSVEVHQSGKAPHVERERVLLPEPLAAVLSVPEFFSLRC